MDYTTKTASEPFDEFDTHYYTDNQFGKNKEPFLILSMHYDFRHNTVLNRKEFRHSKLNPNKKTVSKSEWQILTDADFKTIRKFLMSEDQNLTETDLMTYIEATDTTKRYNPLYEYFNTLQDWGGDKDYIKQLAQTCKTDNDELFEIVLKRFLVASVECILNEDAVNDICLIMQGAQGIGKSRWLRRMLPNMFMREYYYEGPVDTGKNDHVEYLSKCWIINLEELEALSKSNINSVKSFITRQRINFRRTYGKFSEDYIRRASFVGSVNDLTFLTDMTGNRRWLVFKFFEIDHEHKLDINKIWAQAYSLYLSGYRSWFNLEEIAKINARNEQFRDQTYEEELIIRYFGFPRTEDGRGDWISSSDVIDYLSSQNQSQASKYHARSIGKILSKYTELRKRTGGVTKYYLVNKSESDGIYSEPETAIQEGEDEVPF